MLQFDGDGLLFELVELQVKSFFYCIPVKMIPILHSQSLEVLLLLSFIRNFNVLIVIQLINEEVPREVAPVLVRRAIVQDEELR